MPSDDAPAANAGRGGNARGRGRSSGRGGARRGGGRGQGPASTAAVGERDATNPVDLMEKARQAAAAAAAAAPSEDGDEEICFICANPVAHYSISPCNHKTCHICGLRMRALYNSDACSHCRTMSPFIIFTDDADKRFEEYSDADFTTVDKNIGIKYAKEDIVGDTVLLLRYNCPDDGCDFAGLGWPDLQRHVKTTHKQRMCDLCTRNKKVFTHEHELFSDKELEKHMRRGDDKPGAVDQTGFKGHPLCGFCGERFYDDDKLYEHCRMKHERCFICDRRDSRQPHYFLNYDELEKHFKKDHFLCSDRGCLEKKFVVFESELDMQAHQLAEHAGGRAVGRDARLVDISSFDIRQSYQEERRGGGGGGGGGGSSGHEGRSRGRAGRGARGRDPNVDDHMLPTTTATLPLRRDEIAFQRQMAINSAPQGSGRTFRGQLSQPAPPSAPATTTPSPVPTPGSRNNRATTRPRSAGNTSEEARRPPVPVDAMEALSVSSVSSTAALSAEERARLVRHGSVIERAANLLGNDGTRMATFRTHVSSYRQGSLTAAQLVDALLTLLADVSSNAVGTLVRELAELFDDKNKADSLRRAWQDWRAINEDYPSLPRLDGIQGQSQSSSSSGWASAAAVSPAMSQHSTRVLKLKNSTRLGGPAPNTSRALPGWVTSSSSSSSGARPPPPSAFPSLPSQQTQQTQQPRRPPPPPARGIGGEEAFPALPAAPKPQTTIFGHGGGRGVRRDWGQQESSFQWGGGGAAGGASSAAEEGDEEETGKKKGKKKKILVQWG